MPPDKTIDIFLSYSRSDTALMRRLHTDLQTAGFTVWIDQNNLTPGTASWQRAVENAINESCCIVVLLSPDAKLSKWVEIEVSLAEDLGLPVIPLLVKGNDRNAVLFRLIATHRIDLRSDYQVAMQTQLIPALRQYLQRPQARNVIISNNLNWWQQPLNVAVLSVVLLIFFIITTRPYWRSGGAPGTEGTPTLTALPSSPTTTQVALAVNSSTMTPAPISTATSTDTAVPSTATLIPDTPNATPIPIVTATNTTVLPTAIPMATSTDTIVPPTSTVSPTSTTPVMTPKIPRGIAIVRAPGRLRVRSQPNADAPIVGYTYDGEAYKVLGKSDDALWIQIAGSTADKSHKGENPNGGWVVAQFVVLGE